MKNAVKIVSSELLAPAKEIHNGGLKKMKLTPFDLCMQYVPYQKRMLFYTQHSDTDVVGLLRQSLAEVLVIFYPLAGRLSKGSLEIDCSGDLNVRFNQAETNMNLKDLEGFQPSDFCDSLCDLGNPPPKFPWTSQYPLLFTQVTKFACGGISIGVGFSHQVVDGVSAWHFITSWAEFARRGHVSMLPEISYNYEPPAVSVEEIKQVGRRIGMLNESGKSALFDNDDKKPEKLVTKPFKLDTETIEKLKSDAGMGFSTFVVVCAYFWQKATLAKGLPESNISRFIVLVNCRGRIKSIPKAYFGNACAAFVASTTVGNLKQGGISYAAGLLQDGIRGFDEDIAEKGVAFIKWMLENPEPRVSDSRPFMQAVGSIRHPVYESDFGFGKPVGATFGNSDLHDGKVYLFPSADGDGVTATLVLEPGTLERLDMNAS